MCIWMNHSSFMDLLLLLSSCFSSMHRMFCKAPEISFCGTEIHVSLIVYNKRIKHIVISESDMNIHASIVPSVQSAASSVLSQTIPRTEEGQAPWRHLVSVDWNINKLILQQFMLGLYWVWRLVISRCLPKENMLCPV